MMCNTNNCGCIVLCYEGDNLCCDKISLLIKSDKKCMLKNLLFNFIRLLLLFMYIQVLL